MGKNLLLPLILTAALTLLITNTGSCGKILDEQFGPGGSTVQLVKAKIKNGVLTLAVRYIHPWEAMSIEKKQELKDVTAVPEIQLRNINIKFKVQDVFYVADGKKYKVLKDKEGNWLASPVVGDYIAEPIGQRQLKKHLKEGQIPALRLSYHHPIKVLWFKFPAPPEGVTEIEFQIPEVSPFDVELEK